MELNLRDKSLLLNGCVYGERLWACVVLKHVDAYTHSTGQCQFFDVQPDELWVFVIE